MKKPFFAIIAAVISTCLFLGMPAFSGKISPGSITATINASEAKDMMSYLQDSTIDSTACIIAATDNGISYPIYYEEFAQEDLFLYYDENWNKLVDEFSYEGKANWVTCDLRNQSDVAEYMAKLGKIKLLDTLDEALSKRDYKRLVAVSDSLLQYVPDLYWLLSYKCIGLYHNGDVEGSREVALKAYDKYYWALDKDHPMAFLARREPAETYELLAKIRKFDYKPGSIEARRQAVINYYMGTCLKEQGRNREAVDKHFYPLFESAFVHGEHGLRLPALAALAKSLSSLSEYRLLRECIDYLNKDGDARLFCFQNNLYRSTGRLDIAIDTLEHLCHEMRMYTNAYPIYANFLITDYNSAGRYDDAIALGNQILETDTLEYPFPQFIETCLRRGYAYKMKGENEKAIFAFEQVAKIPSEFQLNALALLGRVNELEACLNDPGEKFEDKYKAAMYSAAGLYDKAFPILERAFELQQITPTEVVYDQNLAPLAKLPRFAEAVRHYNPNN